MSPDKPDYVSIRKIKLGSGKVKGEGTLFENAA